MKVMPVEKEMTNAIVTELGQSSFFRDLSEKELAEVASSAKMVQYDPDEVIMKQGDASDSFSLVASGEVIIKAKHDTRDELVEVARVKPYDIIGELGMLLDEPRSATVVAGNDTILLTFDKKFFSDMFKRIPSFALVACRVLAKRLHGSSRSMPIPQSDRASIKPDPAIQNLLHVDFVQRHRVLPIQLDGNILTLGFVEDPTPKVIALVREQLPGMELRPTVIDLTTFNNAMQSASGVVELAAPTAEPIPTKVEADNPEAAKLNKLLKRMVAERASDIHLSAAHKPRWRIDGNISEMSDTSLLSANDVLELVRPVMPERNMTQFKSDNDTDFAYAIPGIARFRVNLFRDNKGVGAVFRQIPDKILSIEQLGLPPVARQLCEYPKGLVLVTGPTGSGKSTTLAAMIDHINKTRLDHIITLEDPIEFVHISQKCLVNQREIGPHSSSFARALRAVLREDPDIVLVGEMRDLETVSLALETANTGHLVFGTLHTNTAISTVARIIDMFPAEQQNQVRAVLADNLKGVVAQTLCRRIGGGRIAALEILVSDTGIANLIREGKTHQVISAMQTGKARGNRVLNEELHRLLKERIITEEEALAKAVDKPDLTAKLGIKLEMKAAT